MWSVSGPAARLFDKPFLHRYINSTFHTGWRLIGGGVYEGEINGVRMVFYDPGTGPDTYWASFYSKNRIYEHSAITHMKNVASQYDTPTFLDIGAHYGYYTVYMSKLKGGTAKVLSFEPSSESFPVLALNVRLNDADNVTLHRLALSDRRSEIILETSERFQALGYHQKRKMKHVPQLDSDSEDRADAIPFDDLGVDVSPYIIKIDVHGAEGNVITGMRKTLERGEGHLYCELHGEMCDGYTARDVLNVLQNAGMKIFELQGFRRQDGRMIEVPEDLTSRPHGRMIYARKP
jgi:FkbM family methyltransferase